MKKLIIFILTLILFSLFTSQAFAASNETTVTTTIDYVYYDNNDHMYYAVTTEDNTPSQGRWMLEIESLCSLDTNTLDRLNKAYRGLHVVITYTGDITTDSDIEIVSTEFISQ
ncbi:hypothetical protein BC351_00480 [Paenibacillus ferrarius]|uniref:Uncharacterized protein n=1 Tax=Paenibacillus ferrarius TaxID=1469647 RepID=A0A1V4HSE8_9BACL|nr:hypothetical protein [Paenibacillus ferrarius]OPH61752.1 hypothetical protein BC351_00480 [Paenibacillus ferrarius]